MLIFDEKREPLFQHKWSRRWGRIYRHPENIQIKLYRLLIIFIRPGSEDEVLGFSFLILSRLVITPKGNSKFRKRPVISPRYHYRGFSRNAAETEKSGVLVSYSVSTPQKLQGRTHCLKFGPRLTPPTPLPYRHDRYYDLPSPVLVPVGGRRKSH